jgi:cytochrome P450
MTTESRQSADVPSIALDHIDFDPLEAWVALRTLPAPLPSALYDDLRQTCPVARMRMPFGPPAWGVTRFEDVRAVTLNTEAFSSRIALQFGDELLPPISYDPPEHARFRRLLNPFFTPAAINRRADEIRHHVVAHLDKFVASGGGDVAVACLDIPGRMLCSLLGLPPEHFEHIRKAEEALAQFPQINVDEIMMHAQALFGFAMELIEARRKEPKDDLVSHILATAIEGAPLEDRQILNMVFLILIAGHETTTSALLGVTEALARDSELQHRVRLDRKLVSSVIEESLRLRPPVPGLTRVATHDMELCGRTIRAGDHVVPLWGAANADPEMFANPHMLDPTRKEINRHLTFGQGVHNCLGASLAKLQLSIWTNELLSRTSSFKLAEEPTYGHWPTTGAKRMIVTAKA